MPAQSQNMLMFVGVVCAFLVGVAGCVAAVAHFNYRGQMLEAGRAWDDIAFRASDAAVFDHSMIADLPEIGQRYFRHAISPGTRLSTVVELEMEGEFRLGDRQTPVPYAMTARQILAAPDAFVWIPDMRSGLITVSGSDGLHNGHGWTRFWLNGLVPVVQAASTEGLDRSAAARPALESIWAPAALLPQNGAAWTQTGEDSADVSLQIGGREMVIKLRLAPSGQVLEVWTMRWSDENADRAYRDQPFGGTVSAEGQFGGFSIPTKVEVGNLFGTRDYFPFFDAEITAAHYR